MNDRPSMGLGPDARCEGCGASVTGGTAGCLAIFEEMQARSYTDADLGAVHRLRVDVYALQHPDPYCISAKSFAAHLTGVCAALEHHAADPVNAAVMRWLSTNPLIRKPRLPQARGTLTIADVSAAPENHEAAVMAWARSAWRAYAPFEGLARRWIADALNTR
ncbi:MAG TPA: DUF5946 family protein [Candidatus Limnocylindrales bacterium]|nr:DUF5946 family protein [Candidatus Limnocylindrales bacterium]